MSKKTPLRKCVACQQMIDKKELFRIARFDNSYTIDDKGDGRGAYICKNIKCFEKASKSRGLERSFKSQIPKEIYEKIREKIEVI